ncbi:MAG TPA: response regulator transcription factor [Ktedonobacterales bacterium]|jgi:DNA-binding NarL/FixJ family response regulator
MPLQSPDDAAVRVLLVDDQTLLRQGFQRLLELGDNRVQVVGAASDGVEALALIERLERENRLPQVVLMDIRMPRMDGVQATAQIRARWPLVRVLMLTTFDNDEYVFDGLRAGASGYMLKDASAEELVAAIHAASRGESPLQPSIAAKLVARLRAESPEQSASTGAIQGAEMAELTEREREILRYLARGASNREIGEALYITEGTVKNHVSNILNKLALRDRTQAALWAREHSLV